MKNIITKLAALLLFLFFIHTSYPQQTIDGSWSGAISIMGSELGIDVRFKTDTDSLRATIDIPQQNAKDLKLIHVEYTSPKVYFELPAGTSTAVFDGKLEGDSIKGKFTQAGMEGEFHLVKGELKTEQKEEITELLPYNSEEVTFTNGDIKFAGTLTIPKTEGKHPTVVMITGSGPQNRDEELFGFKPFKIIADYLTRNGIAVLRYDDEGVGGSTGKSVSQYTTEDFAGDVLEAVKFLKTRNDINPEQIGLIGHSEGGIVAPLAASKSKAIAFIVLMAGTGVKGIDILKEQAKLIMEANKTPEEDIKANEDIIDKGCKLLESNGNLEDLRPEVEKMELMSYNNLPEEKKNAIKDKDEYIKTMVDAKIKQFSSPWMKFFLSYDPAPTLEKVKCPVLMLFGELDLQVPPAQNKAPMEKALQEGSNKDYMSVVFPKANHLFLSAVTGSPEEYTSLKKEFVPDFLDTIKNWITQRVTVLK
jgi:dienelactone hydrolase